MSGTGTRTFAGMPSQHRSGERPRALLREAARTSSRHPAIGLAAVTDESDTDSNKSVFHCTYVHAWRIGLVRKRTERQNNWDN